MERGAKSAKAKVEARPTVTRKPRKVVAPTGLQFKQLLAEASEQQAAISEILRVISSSPGDVTPVLATVAERAAHLCDASFAQVLLVEGSVLRPTIAYWAEAGLDEEHDDSRGVKRTWPLTRSIISGRAVLDCETIHHADVVPLLDSEYPDSRAKQMELGVRAVLVVPLMREGGASGVIFLFRREPRAFSPEQISLVQTFARQAAIAIENVRLFKVTKEALEQQTATSDILRVISQSPTDVQPVFDTIAKAALKLCNASQANVFTFDGKLIHLAALAHADPRSIDALRSVFPRPPSRATAVARAVLTRSVVAIPDILEDPEFVIRDASLASGFRSVLAVPLMHDGIAIGAIALGRPEPGPFPEKQMRLLQTFADQAVIAVENVRLFNETKEALEQQTATSEILRVISSSPTRLEPVLEAVVKAAAQFCGAPNVVIMRVDGGVLRGGTGVGQFAEIIKQRAGSFAALEIPIARGSVAGRAVFDRRTIHVHDLASENEDEYPLGRQLQGRFGHHTTLATPLLREGVPLGVILLFRMEVNAFSEKQIELLRTFADQAVIAIENVRSFDEVRARTRELSESLQQQTARRTCSRLSVGRPSTCKQCLIR
jgi:GAF domain-containing protein